MPATSLQAALTWLDLYAEEYGYYTIMLSADETIGPRTLSYSGKQVSITIKGDMAERWVFLESNGSLFTVENGITLTLDNGLTLQGRTGNNSPLVKVNGGTLVMNTGAEINGNASTANGSGVSVGSNSAFTMNNGTIRGNFALNAGGGVFVEGIFTMNDGDIVGNAVTATTGYVYGNGVCVSNTGIFNMNGGTISGSAISGSNGARSLIGPGVFTPGTGTTTFAHYGGGVYTDGAFTMNGGTISGNSASYGGGVFADNGRTFTMSVGTISGNSAGRGGGVLDLRKLPIFFFLEICQTKASWNALRRHWATAGLCLPILSEMWS